SSGQFLAPSSWPASKSTVVPFAVRFSKSADNGGTAMDAATQQKWDKASRTLDFFTFAEDRRLGPHKRRLFEKSRGETLLVAAGTGNDFKFFPPRLRVVAIDISPKMLERAAKKAAIYPGTIELQQMDVCDLEFPDAA